MPEPRKINLGSVPKARQMDIHIWADYVELLCLFNIDGEVSRADVLDRVRERVVDLGEGWDDENGADTPETTEGEKTDKWEVRLEDWFSHLAFRTALFREWYPFVLSPGRDELRRRPLNEARKLYLHLLFASNLRYFQLERPVLTKCFELLSGEALRTYLPDTAEVHVFGTADAENRYRGHVFDKISTLAADIRESVRVERGAFAEDDYGDNGLDIVGWIPLGDDNSSLLLVFGQCACTEEWIGKQHSSSADRWQSFISFTAPPTNFVFVPMCLRQNSGAWHEHTEFTKIVMIDRFRMLSLLREKTAAFVAQPVYAKVNELSELHESVF